MRAIDYMVAHLSKPTFFIFSDEKPGWIKKNLKINYPHEIVGDQNDMFDDMQLMASCRHAIISNGTFAWWAAWLSNQKGQIVVAPDPWLLNSLSYTGIVCKNWVKMPARFMEQPPLHQNMI